jgi:glycosyltransferase involved in cell wall biosynthesis
MRLSFLAPTLDRPVGGAAIIYEFASAMAHRGHEVHVLHLDIFGSVAESAEDIHWFEFADDVEHHFLGAGPYDASMAPDADIIFGYSPEAAGSSVGLPVVFIQGYRMLSEQDEEFAFRAPCPKICVAGWLVDVGLSMGVPAEQLVHVPLGIRHETFRVTAPIGPRPPVISFCYNPHPQKGAAHAVAVLEELRRVYPDLPVTAFGGDEAGCELPDWVQYHRSPALDVLVDRIYNGSSIFLMPSWVEGFGLPALEAMACGAALVSTDNGGSRDYADHRRTAMVSERDDVGAMVANVAALLEDDDLRVRIATEGVAHARTFSWERSAERLETFLEDYLDAPQRYGR